MGLKNLLAEMFTLMRLGAMRRYHILTLEVISICRGQMSKMVNIMFVGIHPESSFFGLDNVALSPTYF